MPMPSISPRDIDPSCDRLARLPHHFVDRLNLGLLDRKT
jgi:hypothetical protein